MEARIKKVISLIAIVYYARVYHKKYIVKSKRTLVRI